MELNKSYVLPLYIAAVKAGVANGNPELVTRLQIVPAAENLLRARS